MINARWRRCGGATATTSPASACMGLACVWASPQPERLAPCSGHCRLAIMLAALSKGLVPVQAAAAAAALPAALQQVRRFAAEPAAAAETANGTVTQVRGPMGHAGGLLGWGAWRCGATLAGLPFPVLWMKPGRVGRGAGRAWAPLQPLPDPPAGHLARPGLPQPTAPGSLEASPIPDCCAAGRRGGGRPTGGGAPPAPTRRAARLPPRRPSPLTRPPPAGHRCRGGRAL